MMRLDAVGVVRMRLGEHVLHTWDLAVMQDPAATVQADAAELLIDNVPQFLAPRLGKPLPEPFAARITTVNPDRDYLLTSNESVKMESWPGDFSGDAEIPRVTMPAEALSGLPTGGSTQTTRHHRCLAMRTRWTSCGRSSPASEQRAGSGELG